MVTIDIIGHGRHTPIDPSTGFAKCGLRAHVQVAASMSQANCDACFERVLRDAPQVAEPALKLGPRKHLPPLPNGLYQASYLYFSGIGGGC